MKLLYSGIYLLGLLAVASAARAEDASFNSDDDAIRISGKACERFTPNEAKSTIRVRVTDKASFLAVSSAEEVNSLRDEMNEHDYNVLVYNLVDNAVENLVVRTTKQDDEELCVEVDGHISLDSILQALTEQTEEEPGEDERETMTDIVNEVNTSYSEIGGSKPEVIPPTDEAELAKYKAWYTLSQLNFLTRAHQLFMPKRSEICSRKTKVTSLPIKEILRIILSEPKF